MTTETAVNVIESAANHGYVYVESDDIDVVSVTTRRNEPFTDHTVMLAECLAEFRPMLQHWRACLPSHRILLFMATMKWARYNVVQRRKTLLRNRFGWLEGARRVVEIELHNEDGIRRAGIAELVEEDLLEVGDYTRWDTTSFIFLSEEIDVSIPSAHDVFARAFPNGERMVNWESVIRHCSATHDIYLKLFGAFDDPEVSIDAFMSSDLRKRISSTVDPIDV